MKWKSYLTNINIDEDKIKNAEKFLNELLSKADKQKESNVSNILKSKKYEFVKGNQKINPKELVGYLKTTNKLLYIYEQTGSERSGN